MNRIIFFLAGRMLTKSFWLLVFSTFLGVLMFTLRNFYRNAVFQEAMRLSQPGRYYAGRP